MIPLIELCEMLSCERRYSWFYLKPKYLAFYSLEDFNKIAHIEQLPDAICRVWYPLEKWEEELARRLEFRREQSEHTNVAIVPKTTEDDLRARIKRAAMRGDFGEVLMLKQELDKVK